MSERRPLSNEGALDLVRRRGDRRVRRRRTALAGGVAAVAVATASAIAVASSGSSRPVRVLGGGPHPTVPLPPATATTASTSTTTTLLPPGETVACGPGAVWKAAPGSRVSTTASLGPVTATLRGTTSGSFSQSWSGVTLTVVTGGNTVLSAAVTPPAGPGAGSPSPGVTPWFIGPSPSPASTPPAQVLEGDPLCLARFAGQSRPTVLLGMTLGGAHCCTVVRAFAVGPSSVVPPVDIDLGNPGATITAHAGGALVVTADNDFAYAFASFAGSGMPIRVYQFDAGKFVDTTRQHLDLVAADEATWWQGFTRDPSNGLGLLAAWVADECVLGRATSAWSVVDQYQAQGKLSGLPPWPSGAAYVQQLHAFLFKHGYCPAA